MERSENSSWSFAHTLEARKKDICTSFFVACKLSALRIISHVFISRILHKPRGPLLIGNIRAHIRWEKEVSWFPFFSDTKWDMQHNKK